jgi:hypothetical protein
MINHSIQHANTGHGKEGEQSQSNLLHIDALTSLTDQGQHGWGMHHNTQRPNQGARSHAHTHRPLTKPKKNSRDWQ